MSVIWDMETIRDVQHQYVDSSITDEMLERGVFREPAFRDILALEYRLYVVEHIQVYVRHGISFTLRELPKQRWDGNRSVRIDWNPDTKEIEFLDGPLKGTNRTINKIGNPYIGLDQPTLDYTQLRHSGREDPSLDKVRYNLFGWNDTTGRWVYTKE